MIRITRNGHFKDGAKRWTLEFKPIALIALILLAIAAWSLISAH